MAAPGETTRARRVWSGVLGALAILLVGIAVLAGAAELLVRGASQLAETTGASPVLIGTAVVGVGSALPELASALLASLRHVPVVATGSVVGATTMNLTLVIGITGLLASPSVEFRLLRREVPATLGAAILFGGLLQLGLRRVEGVVLLVALIGASALVVWRAREDLAELRTAIPEHTRAGGAAARSDRATRARSVALAQLAVGLAGTIGAADAVITGALRLAALTGMAKGTVGLTLVALGGALPELAAGIAASRRGEGSLLLGNVLGSSLTNCLGVGAVVALVAPGSVPVSVSGVPTLVMSLAALATTAAVLTGARLRRIEGAGLVALYFVTLPFALR